MSLDNLPYLLPLRSTVQESQSGRTYQELVEYNYNGFCHA
jgi:hypothetical protein